ncbi:MAG TPA: 6,7-dimethyl-8-ribityllumazine synthase, partial [Verrucomicrobiae bacterium]
MLKKIRKGTNSGAGGRYAIIAAKYNGRYTDALVRFAKSELKDATSVRVIRVPGSFEIQPSPASSPAAVRLTPSSASVP